MSLRAFALRLLPLLLMLAVIAIAGCSAAKKNEDAARTFKVGDRCELYSPDPKVFMVTWASDCETYDAYAKAKAAGDEAGMSSPVLAGKVGTIGSGTKGEVVQVAASGTLQLKLLDGGGAGDTIWVSPRNCK